MRTFSRPLLICANCNTKIYNSVSPPESYDEDPVSAEWPEPPGITENCPRCGTPVDTTAAYPFIRDFPPNFESLRNAYAGFAAEWERERDSFEKSVGELLKMAGVKNAADAAPFLQAQLNSADGMRWYRQRMFYRSATAFYRSLQLFLAFLTLDRRNYISWAGVTGYYSRFYFIQSFLNLILATFINIGKFKIFIFHDGQRIVCNAQSDLPKLLQRAGSHDIWWSLMEALKTPNYPCENLGFILSRLVFNPEQRQNVNYDYEYLHGGFIELDWFDSGALQLLRQFMPHPRPDRDITNIDRFFEGHAPGNADIADFDGDDAQMMWCSLLGYLQMLKTLGFGQRFVLTETVAALSELHIGKDYPTLLQGIVQATAECLQDGFDVEAFIRHYASPEPLGPFFREDQL